METDTPVTSVGVPPPAPPRRRRARGSPSGLLFAAVLVTLVPWPIYLDLDTWTFIWRTPVESFLALAPGAIPMPIGAMAFAVFCVVNALKVPGLSIRTEGVAISRGLVWSTVAVMVLLFMLNTLFGGSLAKFIQLYVMLIAIFGLRMPVLESDIRLLSKCAFGSLFVFLGIHIWSVFTSEYFPDAPVFAYGTLLDASLHGSLVSYPAVVFLYGAVLLIKSISARIQVPFIVAGTVPLLFALYADRRETAVQVLVLVVSLLSAMVMLLVTRRNDRMLIRCIKLAVLGVIPVAYLVLEGHVSSFDRLLSAEGDPRLDIWAAALPDDLVQFLVGNMQASNTAHSFGFSLLVSFGVLGLVPMIFLTVGVLRFVLKKHRAAVPQAKARRGRTVVTRRFILLTFAVSLLSSNIFNTNITQPYYVVNLILLYMLLRTPDTGLVAARPVPR